MSTEGKSANYEDYRSLRQLETLDEEILMVLNWASDQV